MRVGFAIARREVLAEVEPYRPPGSVTIPSVFVVAAALRDGAALSANVARVERERARLAAGFARLGIPAQPSVTNFLLLDLGDPRRAHDIADGLLRRGLVPRTIGADHPLAGHLRFTVRDEAQDGRLLTVLEEVLAASAAPGTGASPTSPMPSPETRP
jgi:histidinol-phosphate aminotransferase